MPILPLPQFEEDLAEYLQEKADREAYERLNVPTTMVVRFGVMKRVGEFPYSGDVKPGCGSKIVVKTDRGVELGEMLTSTCPNAGCSKSVTRQEMLEYIENSGGKDYPFFDATKRRGGMRDEKPRVIRIATAEDLSEQQRLEQSRHGLKMEARRAVEGQGSRFRGVKVVDAEPVLGGELLTIYVTTDGTDGGSGGGSDHHGDHHVDVRALEGVFAPVFDWPKVAVQQVGARDEARITADYERCGQHCCCKNFLKVLKPVSMRSAKVQKATLDPLKISGRCGRLMCCLRYEDQTYTELRKRLPNRKKKVGTPEGNGIVIDTQILTQLALVELDADRRRVAIPVEELTEPAEESAVEDRRGRGDRRSDRSGKARPEARGDRAGGEPAGDVDGGDPGEKPSKKKRRRRRKKKAEDAAAAGVGEAAGAVPSDDAPAADIGAGAGAEVAEPSGEDVAAPKKKRRRRRRKSDGDGPSAQASDGGAGERSGSADGGGQDGADRSVGRRDLASPGADGKPRRRRRRRKPGGDSGGDGSGSDG